MTDRRDRVLEIAKAIHKADPDYNDMSWGTFPDRISDSYLAYAQAAYDALADDLLPELPEGWFIAHISPSDEDSWPRTPFDAYLIHPEGIRTEYLGTGPTIAAAIRNALESV